MATSNRVIAVLALTVAMGATGCESEPSGFAFSPGTVWTSDAGGARVNQNQLDGKRAAYLQGGTDLADGTYVVGVTDASGTKLLSKLPLHTVEVNGGSFVGSVPLAPFGDGSDRIYKVWLTKAEDFQSAARGTRGSGFLPSASKTDSFRVVGSASGNDDDDSSEDDCDGTSDDDDSADNTGCETTDPGTTDPGTTDPGTDPGTGGDVGGNDGGDTGTACSDQFGARYGDQYGDLVGDLYGDVYGDLYGDHVGNHYGDRFGDIYGDRHGDQFGDVYGDVYGDLWGNQYGVVWGDIYGDQFGNAGGPSPTHCN